MRDSPSRVGHGGVAVRGTEPAVTLLSALGCETLADREGPIGGFRWVYNRFRDASRIEPVTPPEDDGDIAAFLGRHGPGRHHVTTEVADIDAVGAAAEAAGAVVVDYADHGAYSEALISPGNSKPSTSARSLTATAREPFLIDRTAEYGAFVTWRRRARGDVQGPRLSAATRGCEQAVRPLP
jgi:methylmalonyl-CoA/ethylmalonyl-CoA epimerase